MIGQHDHSPKIHIARAQLRTALWLYINELDPISIHNLACSSCEILAEITEAENIDSVSNSVKDYLSTVEPKTPAKLVRNHYWNAFKHVVARDGKRIRNDAKIILEFTDEHNDPMLFQGWCDLAVLHVRLPIEAQLYLLWHSELQNAGSSGGIFKFGRTTSRKYNKGMLRQACKEYRARLEILHHPLTDPLPLEQPLTTLS